MKAIEIILGYWEQFQKLLNYSHYCAGHEIQTAGCRDFWKWTLYTAIAVVLLIAYAVVRKTLREHREFERNRQRLEARYLIADEATMEQSVVNFGEPMNVPLSQHELAAVIRESLKAPNSERIVSKTKSSPMRELGKVMRDLTSSIKQATTANALVASSRAVNAQADRASENAPARELATIMLTDMVGYSGAMGVNEQLAYEKLLVHNQIVRTIIASYRGREIKTIGDAFLVIFRSAVDAVDGGLAIQRAFAEYNIDQDEQKKILLRIGIHLGDILITNNDVFGDAVNILARIQPLAQPGGICVSEAVYIHVRKKFELTVERIGSADLKLKNIAIAPDIYHLNMA